VVNDFFVHLKTKKLYLKSSSLTAFLLVLSTLTYAQLSLPKHDVLAENNISEITITYNPLTPLDLDSNEITDAKIVAESFNQSKYWFDKNGYPDSVYSFAQKKIFSKTYFQYNSNHELIHLTSVNNYIDTLSETWVEELPKGERIIYNKRGSLLTDVQKVDKLNRVYYEKRITNNNYLGYDSSIYTYKFNEDLEEDKYYSKGKVSHKLTRHWYTSNKRDSFQEVFYQSTTEAGRLPGYSYSFAVNEDGSLLIPENNELGYQFLKINRNARFRSPSEVGQHALKLFTETEIVTKTDVNLRKQRNGYYRYFLSFDIGYRTD